MPARLTALQGLILCDIDPADREDIDRILTEHGIPSAQSLSLARRYSIACPALPTCGLAVAESERALPSLIDELDEVLAELGLAESKIAVHMTGCPNGCARPYTPDIGLVGKTAGKYTVFLGGNAEGTRLGFLFEDLVETEKIVPTLRPVLEQFGSDRQNGESFGDFCFRVGRDNLPAAQ